MYQKKNIVSLELDFIDHFGSFTSKSKLCPRSSKSPLWGIWYCQLTKFISVTWYSPLIHGCILP